MIRDNVKSLGQFMVDRPDLWQLERVTSWNCNMDMVEGLITHEYKDDRAIFIVSKQFLFWKYVKVYVNIKKGRDKRLTRWEHFKLKDGESRLLVKAVKYWHKFVQKYNEELIDNFAEDQPL